VSTSPTADVVVVGGGIIGLATGVALLRGGAQVTILEAEAAVGRHQSGHNSGVLHSGLYYRPGSLKARLCTAGRHAMIEFCQERTIPHRICGKLVVAVDEDELPRLDELERRGNANGLHGLQRLGRQQIREHEPAVDGTAGLWVPETGIVDFAAVTQALERQLIADGGRVLTGHRVTDIISHPGGLSVRTPAGPVEAGALVNCAGLQSDRVARMAGATPAVRIVPVRGEYYELLPAISGAVNGLIYPVPDPDFPFLGVHLTRGIDGRVTAGPNAVLALKREGYRRGQISPQDIASTVSWPGSWRLASRLWRTGAGELSRALSRRRFAAEVARLVPAVQAKHLRRAGAGVRAQAVDRGGHLVDDFRFVESPRALHVLNAPSPGATASLAIGREIAERVGQS
jgi:L-2-hydroxyglutarate oxidase